MTKIYDTYKEIATNNYNAMKNIFTETTKLVNKINNSKANPTIPIRVSTIDTFLKNSILTFAVFGIILIN